MTSRPGLASCHPLARAAVGQAGTALRVAANGCFTRQIGVTQLYGGKALSYRHGGLSLSKRNPNDFYSLLELKFSINDRIFDLLEKIATHTTLAQLKCYTDIATLRPAVLALCSRYGAITRLDILSATQGGKRQALCFLRMETAQQEQRLISELGVGRFGGDLVLVVDLKSHEAANDMNVSAGPSSARACAART